MKLSPFARRNLIGTRIKFLVLKELVLFSSDGIYTLIKTNIPIVPIPNNVS